jgi:hypothetical protein
VHVYDNAGLALEEPQRGFRRHRERVGRSAADGKPLRFLIAVRRVGWPLAFKPSAS